MECFSHLFIRWQSMSTFDKMFWFFIQCCPAEETWSQMLLGLQFWAWFFCIIFIMSQCGNWNSLLYKFIFKTVAVSTKSKWNKRKQKYYKTAMLNWKTPISFYQTIIFVLGKCYAMVVFLKKEPCILISTLELSGASQLCLFLIFFKLSS